MTLFPVSLASENHHIRVIFLESSTCPDSVSLLYHIRLLSLLVAPEKRSSVLVYVGMWGGLSLLVHQGLNLVSSLWRCSGAAGSQQGSSQG